MRWGKHMAKQLDCTTSIASTQNNGIHGIHFSQHTTVNRRNHLASKQKRESISIWAMDWTTAKSNHFNLQMHCESSSQNSIWGSAMIVGLKIIRLSPAHYITGMISNVSSYFEHISDFRRTWILNCWASQNRKVVEYTARWTPATGGGIHRISLLPEWRLCQSFVHPTRLTWPLFQAISMPGHCIPRMVIFEKISAIHQKSTPQCLLGCFHVPREAPKIQTMHGILRLEQCCPHSGILT